MSVIGDLGSAVARFPGWWLGELGALVPERLRQAMHDEAKWIVLDVSGPGLAISRGRGERAQEIGYVELGQDRAAERRAVTGLLRKLNPRAATVVLRLADTRALRRLVDLPLAAEENLREVLAFEMDRQTPFKPDEVYFDCQVVARDEESQLLRAELTVIPRTVADEALERAADWGLAPQVVDIAGVASSETGHLNLLPPDLVPTPARSGSLLTAALVLLAAGLAATALYLLFERQSEVAKLMAERVAAAKVEAESAASLRKELDRVIEESGFLGGRKRGSGTVTATLDELTQVLPDHTWVYQLRLDKNEVRVSGYSSAASEIIALIDASPAFREVKFRSPVTQDARLGLERFNLSAEILGAAEADR